MASFLQVAEGPRGEDGKPVLTLGPDPNQFPVDGAIPPYCSSLMPGTAERRPFTADGDYYDHSKVEPVLLFFTGLRHTQGPMAGKEFILTPEQHWLICEAFGWLRHDGLRKFRICFVEMGRGNGKSQLGAGIAGYLLLADQELDPEIIGVSADRKTARKYCLERLQSMIRANPALLSLVDIFRSEIRRRESSDWGGSYEATSSEVSSNWGGAPHGIIFDEVHAQPNRELWDAMETAMGKRAQPMMWGFTTAGWDRTSICWEIHSQTMELAKGNISDDTFLGIIWSADEEDDWTDPKVWRRANPVMGQAFEEEFLRQKCIKAQNTPAFQNTFRTLYLSQWVGSASAFVDIATYDRNNSSPLPPPGKRIAYGGLDLSSTNDLSAFGIATRVKVPNVLGEVVDGIEMHLKLYAPTDNIIERERKDKIPYREWVKKGWLTLTPGATIDQEMIKLDIFQAMMDWDLKDISYDRWNASKLIRELEDEGVPMVQMGQGYASMSAPTKSFLKHVADHTLLNGGNGAIRTQLSFTMATSDAAGNLKPDKSKSGARIDGVVSWIMALDGLDRRGAQPRKSAYDYEDEDPGYYRINEDDAELETEVPEVPQYSFRRSAYDID